MRCVVVPMNPWNPEGEIASDLAETGARAVIVPLGADFEHIRRAARSCGAAVIDLARHPEETGLFDLIGEGRSAGGGGLSTGRDGSRFNGPNETALELFTSGTSGRKKRVPIRLRDLCVGAACIAAALELGPEDRGYNMMPLFHVGGIVRKSLRAATGGQLDDLFRRLRRGDVLGRAGPRRRLQLVLRLADDA